MSPKKKQVPSRLGPPPQLAAHMGAMGKIPMVQQQIGGKFQPKMREILARQAKMLARWMHMRMTWKKLLMSWMVILVASKMVLLMLTYQYFTLTALISLQVRLKIFSEWDHRIVRIGIGKSKREKNNIITSVLEGKKQREMPWHSFSEKSWKKSLNMRSVWKQKYLIVLIISFINFDNLRFSQKYWLFLPSHRTLEYHLFFMRGNLYRNILLFWSLKQYCLLQIRRWKLKVPIANLPCHHRENYPLPQ